MRTILFIACAAVVVAAGITHSAAAGERPAQTICPVTGKKLSTVQSPVKVQVQGFHFLVADEASRTKALGNPAQAFASLAKRREAAEPVSQACPVMGNLINKTIYSQKDGYRVYMCCQGCTKRVENNWLKTLDKLNEQAELGDSEDLQGM